MDLLSGSAVEVLDVSVQSVQCVELRLKLQPQLDLVLVVLQLESHVVCDLLVGSLLLLKVLRELFIVLVQSACLCLEVILILYGSPLHVLELPRCLPQCLLVLYLQLADAHLIVGLAAIF